MPDVSYTIYRRSTQATHGNADRVVLVLIGEADALNPKQAVRSWYNDHRDDRAAIEAIYGETLVVIPSRAHHELQPEVETQPRLVFS